MADTLGAEPRQRADGFWDVGAAADLADDGIFGISIGENKIVLVRSAGRILAWGGTCPHAGAPLAEGVRCGDHILCPWHKASFDLRTGARAEPPAVDSLPGYSVRLESGRILVSQQPLPEVVGDHRKTDARRFIILGAGAAGQSAAQTLRQAGFGGEVILISREAQLPYDRTVLSKYRLSGERGAEKTPLQDAAFYARHGILRMTEEVAELDVPAATVRFESGASLTYSAALLATGGILKRPDFPGADLGGVFLLRTPADADAIVAASRPGRRAVILGGSFIAMEVAASLREAGLAVTVVMPEATPFEHSLGPVIGAVIGRLHERKGVVLRTRDKVKACEGDGVVDAVRLESGAYLPADLVVIGSGIRPATDGLRGLPLREDGGVTVDCFLRAGPRLFAAGDLAAFPLFGDGDSIRVEHWRVAQQHGRVAALNMLGRATSFDAVPYFWTIHFLKRLDYVGYTKDWDDIIVDGDLQKPEFIAFYIKDDRVKAVAGWDRDHDMARVICLFEQRRDWQADELLAALAEAG